MPHFVGQTQKIMGCMTLRIYDQMVSACVFVVHTSLYEYDNPRYLHENEELL